MPANVKMQVTGENLTCEGCKYQSLAIGTMAEVVLDYLQNEVKLPAATVVEFMPYYLQQVNERLQDKIQTAKVKEAVGVPNGVMPPRTKPYTKKRMAKILTLFKHKHPPTGKEPRGSGTKRPKEG